MKRSAQSGGIWEGARFAGTMERGKILRFRITGFFLAFAGLPLGALADQVTMKNGDRITGTIQKSDGKTLTMKSDYAGVITLPLDAVTQIKTDKPLSVALKDGQTIQGTVSASGGKVEVAATPTPREVPASDVTAMRDADEEKAYEKLQHPSWDELWNGNVSVGLAGTAGNSQTFSFTTGMNATRVTNTDKTTVYFTAVKASSTINGVSADTAQAVRGGWAYDHNVGARFFVSSFNDYEYDKFQGLNLRVDLGGGLGYTLIKSDSTIFSVQAGADYNHSSFMQGTVGVVGPPTSAAELYWGDDYSVKLSKRSSLVQSFRMFNDVSQLGLYRVSFDATAATQVKKWLTWNVTLSDRYLSDPVPGRKTNDVIYSTGVGIAFSH